MFPDRDDALNELSIAGQMNPGPWTEHSFNVAEAAKIIARYSGLDAEKAFVCGLLHDIGRRTGISQTRHVIDGYDYAMSKGWEDVARICLTHSYPVKDIKSDIAKKDVSDEQYEFIGKFLETVEYDDYDKLIILCDALATADGVCILEKRFVDVCRRYGLHEYTLERWNKTYEYKEYFEKKIGQSIYKILPDIESCIYN